MGEARKSVNAEFGKMEKSAGQLGKTLKRALSFGAAIAGIRMLSRAVQEFTDLATVQIQAEAKLAAVIQATGQAAGFSATQMYQAAAALQSVTTFGDEAIIGMQGILATFKSIQGDVFERTTELALDMSAAFGQDLKSSATLLGKALEEPAIGLNYLRRMGVSFSEEQKAVIFSLAETGRLAEAQGLILDTLAGQIGGVARALAETDAGAVEQFQNRLGDLKEAVGKAVLAMQANFARTFDPLIENLTLLIEQNALGDAIRIIGEGIWNAVKAIFAPDNFQSIMQALGQMFLNIMVANLQTFGAFLGHGVEIFKNTADRLGEDWIKEIMNGIVRGVTAGPRWVLALLGVEGARDWRPFETSGPSLGESLRESIAEQIPGLLDTWKGFYAQLGAEAVAFGNTFGDAVSPAIDDMNARMEALLASLRAAQTAAAGGVAGAPGAGGGGSDAATRSPASARWGSFFVGAAESARRMIEVHGVDVLGEIREFVRGLNRINDAVLHRGDKAARNKEGKVSPIVPGGVPDVYGDMRSGRFHPGPGGGGGFDANIGDAIGGIFSNLGSMFSMGLGSVMEFFTQIENVAAVMDPLGTIMGSLVDTIAGPLNAALAPLVGLLEMLGKIAGQTLIPFITAFGEALKPVIQLFADLYNNVLRHLIRAGTIFQALLWNLGVLIRNIITFNWFNLTQGMVDIAGIKLGEKISLDSLSDAGAADSGGAMGAGATYRQQRPIDVTVNVFDNDVYGGSLQEFAIIIRSELEELAELGL